MDNREFRVVVYDAMRQFRDREFFVCEDSARHYARTQSIGRPAWRYVVRISGDEPDVATYSDGKEVSP